MPSLILLIGPQGSGKTTYAKDRFPLATRISQDDLGRAGHLREFEHALETGQDLLIDRINHQIYQRQRYALPARAAGYRIHYVWLEADRYTCLKRLGQREGHPTVGPSASDHEKVLENYFQNFEPPSPDEYDQMEVLPVHDLAPVLDLRSILGNARTWVIGDVHGCFDELRQLLRTGGYRPADVLIFTGDLVNRGPKITETLEFVRDTPNVFVVKGNHDDRFARHLAGRNLEICNGLGASSRAAESWTPEQREACLQWIESWPYLLRLPDLAGKPFYVVHAGVNGATPMNSQTQYDCLFARYFGGKDPFDGSKGPLWYHTLTDDRRIAFGHIPHRDTRPAPYGLALDGGAVKGGVLRAFIRDPDQPEGRIIEVPSKKYCRGPIMEAAAGHVAES
jgi:predicted kinase